MCYFWTDSCEVAITEKHAVCFLIVHFTRSYLDRMYRVGLWLCGHAQIKLSCMMSCFSAESVLSSLRLNSYQKISVFFKELQSLVWLLQLGKVWVKSEGARHGEQVRLWIRAI